MHTIQTVTVQDSEMEVFLFMPQGEGPHPGLILAQHIPVGHTGLENDEFTLRTAERYALNGFAVAAPFIFHWWPKAETIEVKREEFRDDWTVKDLAATYDLLAGRNKVDGDRIGVVGHCWGGRVSWLGACHNPKLAACVMFYGGRVKLAMGPGTPPAIDLAGQIKCPVAGYFGALDQNPSPEDVADISAALDAAGVAHEFHSYEGANHGFQMVGNPERYHAEASEDAWKKALEFLKRNLI